MTPEDIARIMVRLDMQDEVLGEMRADQKEIKAHVSRTNGRVLKLELWQARVLGAIAVLMFLVAAVAIPVLAAVL